MSTALWASGCGGLLEFAAPPAPVSRTPPAALPRRRIGQDALPLSGRCPASCPGSTGSSQLCPSAPPRSPRRWPSCMPRSWPRPVRSSSPVPAAPHCSRSISCMTALRSPFLAVPLYQAITISMTRQERRRAGNSGPARSSGRTGPQRPKTDPEHGTAEEQLVLQEVRWRASMSSCICRSCDLLRKLVGLGHLLSLALLVGAQQFWQGRAEATRTPSAPRALASIIRRPGVDLFQSADLLRGLFQLQPGRLRLVIRVCGLFRSCAVPPAAPQAAPAEPLRLMPSVPLPAWGWSCALTPAAQLPGRLRALQWSRRSTNKRLYSSSEMPPVSSAMNWMVLSQSLYSRAKSLAAVLYLERLTPRFVKSPG